MIEHVRDAYVSLACNAKDTKLCDGSREFTKVLRTTFVERRRCGVRRHVDRDQQARTRGTRSSLQSDEFGPQNGVQNQVIVDLVPASHEAGRRPQIWI